MVGRIVLAPKRAVGPLRAQEGSRDPEIVSRAEPFPDRSEEAGVQQDRIYQVSGKANSDPLYADDPTLPGNRRIAIVLLREKPVLPPDDAP